MKKIATLLIISLFSAPIIAQSLVKDATEIAQLFKSDNCDPIPSAGAVSDSMKIILLENDRKLSSDFFHALRLLRRYLPENQQNISLEDAYNIYKDNPFFAEKFSACNPFSSASAAFKDNFPTLANLSSLQNSFLNLPVTTAADGAAQFLVERTKKELSLAFLKTFQDSIINNEVLNLLFPQAALTLGAIDTEIYRFSGYIQALHEAFRKDLELLPLNLIQLLETDLLNFDTDRKRLLLDFLLTTQQLIEGKELPDVITFLANLSAIAPVATDDLVQNIRAGLQSAQLLSNALRTDDRLNTYISLNEFAAFSTNRTAVNIFLGVLWQQAGSTIIYADGSTFRSKLETIRTVSTALDFYLMQLRNILLSASQMDNLIKEQNGLTQNFQFDPENPIFHQYVNYAATIIESLLAMADQELFQEEIQEHFIAFRAMMNLLVDVKRANFSTSIVNLYTILVYTLQTTERTCLLDQVLTYGSLIASVATAKTSAEAAAAIEAFALPVGSASIKRFSDSNIALNAYVGLQGGGEVVTAEGALQDETRFFGSLFAPIGVAFSTSMRNNASLSAFISVVDLGALTAFRFNDDETANLPEITLDNIIAPGGYLIYGIPKTPISIGVGGQWGPNLRAVTSQSLSISEVRSWRYGAFLAVDIPILNLRNKSSVGKGCR